jgi:hypothetical protein
MKIFLRREHEQIGLLRKGNKDNKNPKGVHMKKMINLLLVLGMVLTAGKVLSNDEGQSETDVCQDVSGAVHEAGQSVAGQQAKEDQQQ